MKFNTEQLIAIRHNKGPCLVLAGPGSGKTTVIVNRVRFLTEECDIPPEKILVITFTRAAAAEMKERYRVLSEGGQGVSFGTFHALFFKILRFAYNYDSSSILTEDERNRFLRDAAEKAGVGDDIDTDLLFALSNEISCMKNSGKTPSEFRSSVLDRNSFKAVCEEFEKKLRTEMKLDFDDMLLLCARLFKEREDILHYWQEVYDYILIDEFQDICPLQYDLTMRLAEKHRNVFVVGDDDQSIYSFRGADPDMLFRFDKEYKRVPGYEKIYLSINYRCSPEITGCASELIGKNKKRFKKDIRSGRFSLPRVSTVLFRSFAELKGEVEYTANMTEELIRQGIDISDIAVLYRVNTQPGPLISAFKERNIRFSLRDAVPNIYEHWIAKNIFAYIELAGLEREKRERAGYMFSGNTSEWRRLFLSIANRPVRYITRETMRKRELDLDGIRREYAGKSYVCERIDKLKYDLYAISRMTPTAAVKYIRKAVGYEDFIKKYASERHLDTDGFLGIMDELEASSKEFENYEAWKAHIREYTEALKEGRLSGRDSEKEPGVNLLTFHGAKGMEFDTVFIIDASEDYTPYWQAETSSDIEEERRMFYVAVTRAKNRLFIMHSDDRMGKNHECTRFIKEMGLRE